MKNFQHGAPLVITLEEMVTRIQTDIQRYNILIARANNADNETEKNLHLNRADKIWNQFNGVSLFLLGVTDAEISVNYRAGKAWEEIQEVIVRWNPNNNPDDETRLYFPEQ